MRMVKKEQIKAKKITTEGGNYFFGYYDIQPWNLDETYHFCHNVDFWQRMPQKDDIAEIGMIDIHDNEYIKLDTTTAWNFQQDWDHIMDTLN